MFKRIILIVLIVQNTGLAQKQQAKVFSYNIGFGGLSGAIGAVCNKPKAENWKKCFFKGFWQGSIGGFLAYSGKKTTFLINKNNNLAYAWPAKIIHSAGASIIENAALNEPFLQNWNIDLWAARVDFSINGRRKFRARFLPTVITSVYVNANLNTSFDFESTLLTGTFVFESINDVLDYNDPDMVGNCPGRSIAYSTSVKYYTIAHEYIHNFQYREYLILNSLLKPVATKFIPKKIRSVFDKYIYPDIPYFHGFYLMEGQHNGVNYYRNFYEFEAERFATNSYVRVY